MLEPIYLHPKYGTFKASEIWSGWGDSTIRESTIIFHPERELTKVEKQISEKYVANQ